MRSRNANTATRPTTVIAARYAVIATVEPVALNSDLAIVGANAPPMIEPMAYVIDTPEKRTDAGNSSAYIADCWP